MRRLAALLLALAGCVGCELQGNDLVLGDSIFGYSAKEIAQEGFRRERLVTFAVHGGSPLGSGVEWSQLCEQAGEYDRVYVSLGSNDEQVSPVAVQMVDAACGEPFWMLPLETVRPEQRATLQAEIPLERQIDLEYELGPDGLHPSGDCGFLGADCGQGEVARALFDAT